MDLKLIGMNLLIFLLGFLLGERSNVNKESEEDKQDEN